MSQNGIVRAAVLYNFSQDKYVVIDEQTTTGDPSLLQWTWVTNPNTATRWVNILELQYFLTDTPLGDPAIVPYPWEVQWMYFSV
jgi:hypothetical protein